MNIRNLEPEEKKYAEDQSSQISAQTGYVACLFGVHDEITCSCWSDIRGGNSYSEKVKKEIAEILNTLTKEGFPLHDQKEIQDYAHKNSESLFQRNNYNECGFCVDTDKYSYIFRCIIENAKINFRCYCYVKQYLASHIDKAKRGIRFIDPNYHEKFRIPDGNKIQITYAWGETKVFTCRYIDDCHVEIGNDLYHICQFAELLKRNGHTVNPFYG